METSLEHFVKTKEFLICVDSDGCVMDTMDVKHIQCFGPCIVEEWGLSKWESSILKRWNDINLYTMTRGINRFKGLAMILREISDTCQVIEDMEMLEKWAEESPELSNPALVREIEINDSIILKKALSWSNKVNDKIRALPDEKKKAYPGAKESLALARKYADIAVVSSANLQSVEEDWGQNGLLEYVDVLLAQNMGSKSFCIQELLKKGYEREKVLMIGDAPGDYDAAKKNEVYYYPILVRHEAESWEEFRAEAVGRLTDGIYGGSYQEKKIKEFENNLK